MDKLNDTLLLHIQTCTVMAMKQYILKFVTKEKFSTIEQTIKNICDIVSAYIMN